MLRLIILSFVSAGLYALLAVRSDVERSELFEQNVEFYVLWIGLFIVYAMAIRTAGRKNDTAVYVVVCLTAAGFRATQFLGSGLDHSDTAVFLHGASPWSVLFDHFEASFEARRLAATAADLGSLLLAPSLLRAAGLPIGAALVHGWNPFIVKEVAGSGRLDAVAIFFLIAALRLAQTPRFRGAAAVAYGVSLNGPLLLAGSLPLMGRALRGFVAPALVIGVLGWTLTFPGSWYMRAGWPPENSLGGSLTPALQTLAGLFLTRHPTITLLATLLLWLVWSLRRATRSQDPKRWPLETLVVLGGLIFVMPQVLPWAFLLVGTLAPYSENRGWLLFTATAPVTYLAFGDGAFGFWLGFTQYFAAYAVLIFFGLGRPRREAAGDGPTRRPRAPKR